MYLSNRSINLSLSAALGLLLTLPGCVQEYQKIQLKSLNKQSAHFEQTKDSVTVGGEEFNVVLPEDDEYYL